MSITRLCIHPIEVYQRSKDTGRAFGQSLSIAPRSAPIMGRVMPLTAGQIRRLGMNETEINHRIDFGEDPAIDETCVLKWRDVVLRPVGVPVNLHGLGAMWVVYCKSATKDMIGTETRQE